MTQGISKGFYYKLMDLTDNFHKRDQFYSNNWQYYFINPDSVFWNTHSVDYVQTKQYGFMVSGMTFGGDGFL